MYQQIDKPSYNEEFRTCDFSTILGTDTISSGDVVIVDSTDAPTTVTMISNITNTTTSVRYMLKGGVAGEKYTLSVMITTALGQKFVEPFTVCVD